MIEADSQDALIEKRTLHAGSKAVDFRDGTKVHFHFQTKMCNKNETIVDDSRKMGTGKPIELVLGKKFKMEVWEVIIQKLALHEVAEFVVDKTLVMQYPFVAKTLRDVHKPEVERRGHCCAMTIQTEGIGYEDLNNILKRPANLKFIFELVKVEQPNDYERESWQLSEEEKLHAVPKLKELGNAEFKKKNYQEAANNYGKAIAIIEQLMTKEKPHDDEWNELDRLKVPYLLNFAQCKLSLGDFYPVIEHCTTVIKTDPDNVKAYFRRAKAHASVWNVKEAFEDFRKVTALDSTLLSLVNKEMINLEELQKQKDLTDKEKLKNMFK